VQFATSRSQVVAILVTINMIEASECGQLIEQLFLIRRSDDYKGDSNFNALFTPLTFLATYFNSGVNPLLYAILSKNFRRGMSEILVCSFKANKNKMMNKRTVTHVSKLNSILLSPQNNVDDIDVEKSQATNDNVIEFDSICNEFIPTQ